jgi:hypothetical protein
MGIVTTTGEPAFGLAGSTVGEGVATSRGLSPVGARVADGGSAGSNVRGKGILTLIGLPAFGLAGLTLGANVAEGGNAGSSVSGNGILTFIGLPAFGLAGSILGASVAPGGLAGESVAGIGIDGAPSVVVVGTRMIPSSSSPPPAPLPPLEGDPSPPPPALGSSTSGIWGMVCTTVVDVGTGTSVKSSAGALVGI